MKLVDDPDKVDEESEGLDLTTIDIKTMNMDSLREQLAQGVYVLELALFSQAQFEWDRIGKVRSLITEIEDDLFNPDTLKEMSPIEKIKLYSTVLNNMQDSVGFLQTLHKNVGSGIEVISQIEKLKNQRETVSEEDDFSSSEKVDKLKAALYSKIKEKSTKG